MIQAFKRCGYKLVEEKLDFRLQQLSEDLSVSPAWMAGRFEVFMSSRQVPWPNALDQPFIRLAARATVRAKEYVVAAQSSNQQ